MKKILPYLLTLFSFTVSAQDYNGNIISDPKNDNFSLSSFLPLNNTALLFDSVRAVTELNTIGQADAFPWLSADGLRIYYTHDNGTQTIKYAERPNTSSYFSTPVTVNVGTSPGKRSIWLSADELEAYFSSGTTLYYLQRPGVTSAFSPPVVVSLSGGPYNAAISASLTPAMDEMYVYVLLPGNIGVVRQFSKVSATSFTYMQDLSIPAGFEYGSGQLSKDGLTYYTHSMPSAGNPDLLYTLTRPNVGVPFSSTTFQMISDVSDPSSYNSQPTVSGNEGIMIFVRSATNQWLSNQLYMATQSGISSVFTPSKYYNIQVFPNPSNGIYHFSLNVTGEVKIEISNILGEIIYTDLYSGNKINIEDEPDGVYFLKAFDKSKLIGLAKLIKQ